MRRLSHRNRLFVFLVLAAGAVLPALPASADMKYPPFLASLTADQAEYWVGEPILLRCRFVNWLSPTVEITSVFGLHGPHTDLRIASEGKEGEPYHAQFDRSVASDEQLVLRYAKAHEFQMVVLYDPRTPNNLVLSKPGMYQFHLRQSIWYENRFVLGHGQVPYVLAPLSGPVRVVAPPPEFEGALRLLTSQPSVLVDLSRHMANPANWRVLETLVAQYPQSRYAPHCLHALVNGRLHFLNVSPDYQREALTLCERLVRDYPKYALRDEARLRLAELYHAEGRLDNAVEIATQLMAESEDNIYRFRKSPVTRPFRGSRGNSYAVLTESCWELYGTTRLNDTNLQVMAEPGLD